MEISKILLISGILLLVMVLYLSVKPCKKVESFELPDKIANLIDNRKNMLQNQTVRRNILGSKIIGVVSEVQKLKDKVIKMSTELDEQNTNKSLLINTNGEVSTEISN